VCVIRTGTERCTRWLLTVTNSPTHPPSLPPSLPSPEFAKLFYNMTRLSSESKEVVFDRVNKRLRSNS